MVNILSQSKTISDSIDLCGDIIITDPCYVVQKDADWDKCRYGEDMSNLGIKHYIAKDTLYGDWSCTTFDAKTKQPIGEFCADAGMVGVFLLDEVLKYNPNFDYHISRPWTTTLIKNFRGVVRFQVVHYVGTYESSNEFHQAGDPFEDDEVQVVGEGINTQTGKEISFIGKQTGF